MKTSASIGEALWHEIHCSIRDHHIGGKMLGHRPAGPPLYQDLRRIPFHLRSWGPYPPVLFCQNLAFPLPPHPYGLSLIKKSNPSFPVHTGNISFRLVPPSSTARLAMFNEAGGCLHGERFTSIFPVGRFFKPLLILSFDGVMFGDEAAWTGRSSLQCLDNPPDRKDLPHQPEQAG